MALWSGVYLLPPRAGPGARRLEAYMLALSAEEVPREEQTGRGSVTGLSLNHCHR